MGSVDGFARLPFGSGRFAGDGLSVRGLADAFFGAVLVLETAAFLPMGVVVRSRTFLTLGGRCLDPAPRFGAFFFVFIPAGTAYKLRGV
jgi:hypothetical protein